MVNKEKTIIPATEDSAGRTNKAVPHPLCDKIQYCAADYKEYGGTKDSCFDEYLRQLRDWQATQPNVKVQSVLRYVEKGSVASDLIRAGILHCGTDKKLVTEWPRDTSQPDLLKILPAKGKKREQGDALVRWRVQVPGDDGSALWEDVSIRESWIAFLGSRGADHGLCMVTGEFTPLAENHPKRLRHGADGAKLLSSNDSSGFTFRGRFKEARQAYGVGSGVTQKVHNALRWLIGRQGYRAGDQVFVTWAVRGAQVPDPFKNTADLFNLGQGTPAEQGGQYSGDAGQHFALRLKKAIAGYRAQLTDTDDIVVMGLDSATPGRMAIKYYRELTGSEFLDRVTDWHERYAWHQNHSQNSRFIGAAAPGEIAETAFGKRIDDKLRKATVERLLPCIVDARPVPRDLLEAVVRRASTQNGIEKREWEKCLGIACALVRGYHEKENYQMSLEESRCTRDYLYGRLLAIAENIEGRALHIANEKRDTTAAKLMQRFASHPYSTWRNIELALVPYKTRLRTSRPAILLERDKLLDAVLGMFRTEEFISDNKLSGEFLLGYHCQRADLWTKHHGNGEPSANGGPTLEGETK